MAARYPNTSSCCLPLFGKPVNEQIKLARMVPMENQNWPRVLEESWSSIQDAKPNIQTTILQEQSTDLRRIAEDLGVATVTEVPKLPSPSQDLRSHYLTSTEASPNSDTVSSQGFRVVRSILKKPLHFEGSFSQYLPTQTKAGYSETKASTPKPVVKKVDTTANEDCDVDVEEDIPFVAPELLWGIKEMLARAEIQALKDKRANRIDAAHRELDHSNAQSIQEGAGADGQTNRGFDWLSILGKAAEDNPNPQEARKPESPDQTQPLRPSGDNLQLLGDVHPLARMRSIRRSSMMPVSPQAQSAARVDRNDYKVLFQDALTKQQLKYIDRQVLADADREARKLAQEMALDDFSFGHLE